MPSDPISDEEVRELLRLAGAATPGPWEAGLSDDRYPSAVRAPAEQLLLFDAHSSRDAEYIAAANPETIARLCRAVLARGDALREISETLDCEEPCDMTEHARCLHCGNKPMQRWCAGCVARRALAHPSTPDPEEPDENA